MDIKSEIRSQSATGDDKAIEDIVNTQTYTITGFGKSSYYLDLTRDSSTIGNGSMSGFLIIPEDNFTLEAFTEIDVLVDGAIALDCYSDAYEDAVDEVTQEIKILQGIDAKYDMPKLYVRHRMR